MKKIFLLTAALLLCLLSRSQEAESTGSYADLTLIPHMELVPTFYGEEFAFGFGNSSVFALFEGSASDCFSWTAAANLLTVWNEEEGSPFGWQYKYLGYSNVSNALSYLKGDFKFGGWNFSVGKDCMSMGGFEYEDWDWDVQNGFATPLWNSLSCYQWGGKVAWTTPSQMTSLSLQMVTSPLGERPFSSGLYAYSFQWRGEYDWLSNIWSVSAIGYERGKYDCLVCLGQRASFDRWTITLDYSNTVGVDYLASRILKGSTVNGSLQFVPSEKLDLNLKGMWTSEGWQAGLLADFYPLKDSQDLKIHAGVSTDCLFWNTQALTFNVGIRYNLCFHLW